MDQGHRRHRRGVARPAAHTHRERIPGTGRRGVGRRPPSQSAPGAVGLSCSRALPPARPPITPRRTHLGTARLREGHTMRIGIIGAGEIGRTLTRAFSAGGHDVQVANSRGPETIDASALEHGAEAVTAAEAVQGKDVVILSVPFTRIPSLAGLLATVPDETVVIDTSNYFPHLGGPVEAVEKGQVESLWVAEQLGRPVVKAWNAVLAGTLQTKGVPAGTPGRIALPVAADSPEARRVAMRLVDESGFDPFDAGTLADSWRQQPMTPAYCTELGLEDLGPALEAADRDEAPRNRGRMMERFASLTAAPTLDETVELNRSLHR
ncbi:NADPH-dependent F420 reductase [Nocardiopsis tropica]|uniref:NAD(P)-binding domain-containing protein n=1 Tax=Nocardiopsis tropica TaxID=109330 RepID=A0ABU7KPU8_9ACTN|nr:NAD(P)-binding domain-containing protein [Nocardiopsis umidischolae]MEE2051331.1 NAD(P)-binding domain-containing protein [Nocardiopsis umidischolae]